jgi:hypothetical protein
LQSRNAYINAHLGAEEGDDTFADLENFIAPESDEA